MHLPSLIPETTLTHLVNVARLTPSQGCFVEVGVYQGGSASRIYQLAQQQGRCLHLFDTFTGIPYADAVDTHQPGDFSDGVDLAALVAAMPQAAFHQGIFPATLPGDCRKIAFAHIDCDQYESITACIVHLWPRMLPGGVMWFDDPGVLFGARKAVLEHFQDRDLIAAPEGRCYAVKN